MESSGEISTEHRRIKSNCINKRLEGNKYGGLETYMLRNEMAWLLYPCTINTIYKGQSRYLFKCPNMCSSLLEILQTEMKTIEIYATKRMSKENRKRYHSGTKRNSKSKSLQEKKKILGNNKGSILHKATIMSICV